MSVRIICPKCNAVINWNGSDKVALCRLCGTKYSMHPKQSRPEVLMPPVGRGQTDLLTIPNSNEVRGRAILRSYIPKNWKYISGSSPDRYDAVSNPLVPAVAYNSPDGEITVIYKGEAFYKHIDYTPQTAYLQNRLDDILVNRNNPTFLRFRSYVPAANYCDAVVQELKLRTLSVVKEEHADNTETGLLCTFLFKFRSSEDSHHARKFMTSVVITSFSSGLDSAISRVIATSALSLIRFRPYRLYRTRFLCRNSRNRDAAIRLQPSANG